MCHEIIKYEFPQAQDTLNSNYSRDLHMGILPQKKGMSLAKGMHFTASKTQLVRNIRSEVLKKNEETLRDTSIENHPSLEEKGRNRAVQLKQGSQVQMAQIEFPLC